MEKNWLIRTKNNHILGPVSKAKVRELVENGSIKGDDEICSGNGFWFYIREAEMVERFLKGDEEQPFNPVSEAETVLAIPGEESWKGQSKADFPKLPLGENAEYPDDITKVGFRLDELQGLKTPEGSSSEGYELEPSAGVDLELEKSLTEKPLEQEKEDKEKREISDDQKKK